MLKNRLIRCLALLVSFIIMLTSAVNTTFGLIVTSTESIINTFTPFDTLSNALLITKTVEHPFGENYVIPDNIVFDFKLDFGHLYAKTTLKTSVGDVVTDENGCVIVPIKPNKTVAFEGIDAGTEVTVTELLKTDSGFSAKDGKTTEKIVISQTENTKIEFVNVYTPLSVTASELTLNGTKILKGRDWQTGDEFSFLLEQKTEDDTWMSLGTKTVEYQENTADFNKFDFSDILKLITFENVGVYEFRLTEIVGTLENVDYDKTVNTFTVKVTDIDMDGKLEINNVTATNNITVSQQDSRFNLAVLFNNTFVPPVLPDPDDIYVKFTVNKTVNNDSDIIITPEGFEFVLQSIATGEKTSFVSDATGKAELTLTFTAADIGKTYTYKLSETDNGIPNIIYDTDIYFISVTVAKTKDNQLVTSFTMNGKEVNEVIADFENTYQVVTEAPPQTDDGSNIDLWFVMMTISMILFITLLIIDKRYKKRAIND